MNSIDDLAINGGTPIRTKNWPTYEDGVGAFSSEIIDAAEQVLKSGRLFRYDTRTLDETITGKYEKNLERYFGCKHALAVSSGTTALALAVMALDLPKGFSVACPVFGFPATASAVMLAGGIPKLYAVNENLHYDLQDLENRWDESIRAIIVVHMRGMAQPIDELVAFARKKGVYCIEDTVPSLGVFVNSKPLGMYGDIGCFSTQSDKTINTGEGGFIVTNNDSFFERMVLLSGAYEGRVLKHLARDGCIIENTLPLYSFRMDEMRAAIAIPQLEHIDKKVSRLKANYDYVVERVSPYVRIRKKCFDDGYLGESLLFFVDEVYADFVAKAITAEGVKARCIGSGGNVRSFEQWRFLDEVDRKEFCCIDSVVKSAHYLKSTIDISMSVSLDKEDLDDLANAIIKVIRFINKK